MRRPPHASTLVRVLERFEKVTDLRDANHFGVVCECGKAAAFAVAGEALAAARSSPLEGLYALEAHYRKELLDFIRRHDEQHHMWHPTLMAIECVDDPGAKPS